MKRIEIDDDLYAYLASRVEGFEQPNDVIRRELRLDGARPDRRGALKQLIDAGLVEPGDRLVHVQLRKGQRFKGSVTGDGCIEAGGVVFREPSPALMSLTGTSLSGWAHWTHERSGRTLKDLRDGIG